MTNRIELPNDPRLAGKVVQANAALASRKLEMGLLGRLVGGVTEKPGNIAFFAIVLAFLFLALVPGLSSDVAVKNQALTLFGGVITSALGFLFGRTTSE